MNKFGRRLAALGFFLALSGFAPGAGYGQTGAKDVNVVNTARVRDADGAAQNAFHAFLNLEFVAGSYQVIGTIPVPAGKRLVVEYLTIRGGVQPTQKIGDVFFISTIAGSPGQHIIHPRPIEGAAGTAAEAGPVKMYADGGGQFDLTVQASRSGSDATGFLLVSVSGYLVDV